MAAFLVANSNERAISYKNVIVACDTLFIGSSRKEYIFMNQEMRTVKYDVQLKVYFRIQM
ncbi:hypothetical protein D3C71_2161710 [compost metagenome]